MKALIQRVKWARVDVDGEIVGEIGPGILTLFGVGASDAEKDVEWVIGKIAKLRIFPDDSGKMNRSLLDLGPTAGHLLVSQFTLYADTRKGNRPSFIGAGKPEIARKLYEHAITVSRGLGLTTANGVFQADMAVSLLNDGPVTLMIDSELENSVELA